MQTFLYTFSPGLLGFFVLYLVTGTPELLLWRNCTEKNIENEPCAPGDLETISSSPSPCTRPPTVPQRLFIWPHPDPSALQLTTVWETQSHCPPGLIFNKFFLILSPSESFSSSYMVVLILPSRVIRTPSAFVLRGRAFLLDHRDNQSHSLSTVLFFFPSRPKCPSSSLIFFPPSLSHLSMKEGPSPSLTVVAVFLIHLPTSSLWLCLTNVPFLRFLKICRFLLFLFPLPPQPMATPKFLLS